MAKMRALEWLKKIARLIMLFCVSALLANCSSGEVGAKSSGTAELALTPANALANKNYVIQKISLIHDGSGKNGTGTLSVLDNETANTFSFDFAIEQGDASSFLTNLEKAKQAAEKFQVSFSLSDAASSAQFLLRYARHPQVGQIKDYVEFTVKGAYYSVKAWFKHTGKAGGSTLAEAIEDRPKDMEYHGAVSSVVTNDPPLKVKCDPDKQADPAIFNSSECQECRRDPNCLGKNESPPTPPPSECATCRYDFNNGDASLNSCCRFPTASLDPSTGIYTSSSENCSGKTCDEVRDCLKPKLQAQGYDFRGQKCL